MLEVRAVEPLVGRSVRLTLSDGSVVERDLGDVLWGPVFELIARDDGLFRQVRVSHGTIAWPGHADIAPETLIWGGASSADGRRPPLTLRVPNVSGRPKRLR